MQPKFELVDAVMLFGAGLAQGKLNPLQLKVLGNISQCRTAALGGHEEASKTVAPCDTATIAVATGIAQNARLQNRHSGLRILCKAPCQLSIIISFSPCQMS